MLVLISLILLIMMIVYIIISYNSLVKHSNWVKESWSQIDVQLKRRYDLIPNLVNTVKGYASHEKETFERVIEARNKLVSGTPQERMEADSELQKSLNSIFALSESYPELKSDKIFLRLQEELTTTENKVAYARQLYNKTVADYNIKRQSFPIVLFANSLGFKAKEQLSISEAEKEVPTVSF